MPRISTPVGERVAILETTMPEIQRRLEKLEIASEKQDAKLDKLLRMGETAAVDRAEQTAKITAMTPDWKMVASVRSGGKVLMWIGAALGSIVTTLIYAKGWIVLNWNWLLGR